MYASLGEFVRALESAGELTRIKAPADPVLEIAWIADRMSKARCPALPSASAQKNDPLRAGLGGKALLFENVIGSPFPVLINAFGSYRRMEMALGCTQGGFDSVGARIGALVKPEPPKSFGELIEKAKQFLPLLRIPPKRRRGSGPCQEVVVEGNAIDLRTLPIIRCWPHDGDFASLGYPARLNEGIEGVASGPEWDAKHRGRYVTLAGIHTVHADDRDEKKPSSHNIGMYRVQLLGPRTMAMHWHIHHDGASHWRSWKKLGKPMPVAVALGGESALPYAATAPLPPGISELLLAGFINRGGIELVRGKTVPLWIPANAEIVIEGYVSHEAGEIGYDPNVSGPLGPGAVFEGPFGDHTGFYSLPDRYPVLRVTAVTHRRNAIYPTTVVGLPPQEDYFLGKATERVFFPLLKTLIHDIEDYDLPMFGAFHNCAMIKIRKAYALQARRVMHSVWGAGQMAWTKTLFVVDDDVDVHDVRAVFKAASHWCDPLRDIEKVNGPLDILDHAAPRLGVGTKIGFDCTRKRPDEAIDGRDLNAQGFDELSSEDRATIVDAVNHTLAGARASIPAELGGGWLFVRIEKRAAGDGALAIGQVSSVFDDLLARKHIRHIPRFVIVVDQHADVNDADSVLFHWCAHSDAGRDLHVCAGFVAFDATAKKPGDERQGQPVRDWPPVLRPDAEIARRVSLRALELGLPGDSGGE